MRLSLSYRMVQVQTQVAGGATRCLLDSTRKRLHHTETERLLFGHYGIETELPLKPGEKWYREDYTSLLDALFVETFSEFRPSCVAFYEKNGLPLRKILTADEARTYDVVLVGLIEMAHYRRLLGEPGGWDAVQASFYRFITPRPSFNREQA